MLQAYFDESGIHEQSDFILIAGLVAEESIWESISSEWRENLKVTGVDSFHAVDCESGYKQFFGISRGLRDSLFNGLANVISKYKPAFILVAVRRSDWDDHFKNNSLLGYHHPYFLLFEDTLHKLIAWSNNIKKGAAIEIFFGSQTEYEDQATQLFDHYASIQNCASRIGKECKFIEAKQWPAIQAADLLAYEVKRHLDAPEKIRPSGKILLESGAEKIGGDFDIAAIVNRVKLQTA